MNTSRWDHRCTLTFLFTKGSPPYPRKNLTNLTFLPTDSLYGFAVEY